MDQAMLLLDAMKRQIRRSPPLAAFVESGHLKTYARETVYEDDDGGVHRFRALASDAPTGHGINPSLVVIDKGWQFTDYELLEAVTLGPQRRCPLQLWVTYAGLRAHGQPLFDIYREGLAGTDPKLYFSWSSGLKAYDGVPSGFIRSGYLDEQRRMLAARESVSAAPHE